MDQHRDLAFAQAHHLGRRRVVHAVDDLDFEKVIARAERAALVVTAGERPVAHAARVGTLEAAAGLGDEQVAVGTISQVDDVRGPFGHQLSELGLVERVTSALTDPRRNLSEELLDQRPDAVLHVAPFEVRAQQTDTAVDVIADTAGGDDAAFLRISRRHAADAEAVAPVDIGHGQAGLLNAGQGGHVGDLLGPLVALDLLDELIVGEDDSINAHVRPVALGNSPLKRPGRLEGPAISTGIAHD